VKREASLVPPAEDDNESMQHLAEIWDIPVNKLVLLSCIVVIVDNNLLNIFQVMMGVVAIAD